MTSIVRRRMVATAGLAALALHTGTVGSEPGEGNFRAVVAIATKYSGQLNRQPGLATAAQVVDGALRAYARYAGYRDDRIDIKVLMDVDGVFAKAGNSGDNEIKEAIFDAANASMSELDTLVFFFTGHGANDGQSSILFTSGADGRRPIHRILLETEVLTNRWRQSPAAVKLVVLDACQTPAGLSAGSALVALGAAQRWQETDAALSRRQGTALLIGAEEGERAWVDEKIGYGYFTNRFSEALRSGRFATAESLIAEVISRVEADAKANNRLQSPRLRTTASTGAYQLRRGVAPVRDVSVGAAAPPPVVREQADRPAFAAGGASSLTASGETIFDASTGLLWVRDVNRLGSTPEIFKKVTAGAASMKGALLELKQSLINLSIGGYRNWRLATRSELSSLEKLSPATVFTAFRRSKGRPHDLFGLYEPTDGTFGIWGYQYQNTLVGPVGFGAGDPMLNRFGVWLVTGPLPSPVSGGSPIQELREPVVEQLLEPIRGGLLSRAADGAVRSSELSSDSLAESGNLQDVRQTVYEFALKPLAGNAFVRAEILLQGAMASGVDPVLEVSVYKGDGVIVPSLFSSTPATSGDALRWFFSSRSRLELPSHLVRNLFTGGEILGLRFRYAGPNGSIHLVRPLVVISYVRAADLLSRRPQLGLQ